MKHNPQNERIKRKYLVFLKDAKGQSESTLDGVAMAINRFETYTNFKDFKSFHYEQARGFKKYLAKQTNQRTGKPLSKATVTSTLGHIKAFYQWLSLQAGYKSKLNYLDMEYFNASEADTRIATAKREQRVATIEQVKQVIDNMPHTSPVERRNRALIAFILLTGARDSAVASMLLKHVDLRGKRVFQDARHVKTKNSKTFTTYFFPVGEDVAQIVVDWISYLADELGYCGDDPLFPKTQLVQNNQQEFEANGLLKECWANAGPIRLIFKQAFQAAGIEYYNPHSLRNTLVRHGEQVCNTPEEFKVWSQNIGHSNVLTTFTSYGEVQSHRQAEVMQGFNDPRGDGSDEGELSEIVQVVMREMRKKK